MTARTSYDVACPKCGVASNQWCLGRQGQPIDSHRERVQAARTPTTEETKTDER